LRSLKIVGYHFSTHKISGYCEDTGRVNQSTGEEVMDAGEQSQTEEAMQAMWLRKVETRPADFLAAGFN
jgi:hypothetical protein